MASLNSNCNIFAILFYSSIIRSVPLLLFLRKPLSTSVLDVIPYLSPPIGRLSALQMYILCAFPYTVLLLALLSFLNYFTLLHIHESTHSSTLCVITLLEIISFSSEFRLFLTLIACNYITCYLLHSTVCGYLCAHCLSHLL